MRILVVTSIFSPETRGPAVYTEKLTGKVAERKDKIVVITFTRNPVKNAGVKIFSVPQEGGTVVRQSRLLIRIIKEAGRADVIYSQGADVVGFASVVAGKILRKPVVVKFVGDLAWEEARDQKITTKNMEEFLKQPDRGYKTRILMAVTKFVLENADKIIFPAEHLRKSIVAGYKINIDKTEVIYNPIEG